MRPALAFAVALWSLLSACNSRAAQMRDVAFCSDTADARRIAACLTDRGWDAPPAESAAALRAKQLDSIYRYHDDSVWNLDAARHTAELTRCVEQAGEVAACLRLAGWPAARATATDDSLWNNRAAEHQQELQRCVEWSAGGNIADCLLLNFKWSIPRAFAANDSVQLARARR